MPRRVRRFSLAFTAIFAASCTGAPDMQERVMPVFGTIVRVEIAAADAEVAEAALDRLEALYQDLHLHWRSFGPGDLGRVNALLAEGRPAELSPRVAPLVRRSIELQQLSAGLFDPRVGSLVALWGFQDMSGGAVPAQPPDTAAVTRLREISIDRARLHLEGDYLRADAPVTLELAGIAKGSALAAGARLLQANGIANALIVAGGDVIALGTRGDRPWRVGVRHPLHPRMAGSVELAPGEAALSSGNYERRFESAGRVFHHILDPTTGYPAKGSAGATVIARDAELANAAALVLMVGGAGRFDELTRRLGIDCALLITDDGREFMTPIMQRRLVRSD